MSYTNPRKLNRIVKAEHKENWFNCLKLMAKAIDKGNAEDAGKFASLAFHNYKLAHK